MGSKREEERNEKIIRGLMKLPPNRRCINCNSLGPQYVCTNFWTFVCMICSGIHREFTHRVKSVSMSKFTSLEVEALQNGGNQRAREIYLKDWDPQRQRLPNSSNVDKVRDFIKAVYVDQKYVGQNKSDKPCGETQSESNIGEETRRASSYHSYSQSPPYDFQYEDRLNRKKGGPNARKPGAGLFERKTVSFVYSPGRFSDHMYEDRFANEGSSSRASDYSVSSGGGDPFRSAPQSPNLMNDKGLLGPTVDISKKTVDGLQHQGTNTHPEVSSKGDADRVALPRPQRTVSSGFASFGNNPVSLQSSGSSSLFDTFSEHNQSAATPQNNVPTFPAFPPSSTETSVPVNLFEISEGMLVTNSGQGIDLFQEPTGSVSSPSSSSNYFNEISQTFSKPSSVSSVDQKLPGPSDPSDEGWATFDLPQHNTSMTVAQDIAVSGTHSEAEFSFTNTLLSSGAELQWPAFQSPSGDGLGLSVSNPWDEHVQNFDIPANESDDKPWKAFEDDNDHHPFVGFQQQPGLQVYQNSFSVTGDQYLGQNISEGLGADRSHKLASEGDLLPTSSSHIASGLSFNQPILHSMSETALIRQKSGNPFDFDSEREASDEFLGMGGLQEALPSVPLPSSPYAGGINESWFPSSPVASQVGTVPYVMAAPSSPQLPSVPTNGPVASVGGNPFA